MSSEEGPGTTADVMTATLQEGLRESQDLLDFLAMKFDGPLSHLMTVRRKGGLFTKKHSVEEITLRFDERHFQITRNPRGFVTSKILKEVRGVIVKTSTVEVDEWIRELALELTQQAERSDALRSALSRFILE